MVKRVTRTLAGLYGIYAIVVVSGLPNVFGIFVNTAQHRAISLVVALVLVFLAATATGHEQRESAWWVRAPLLILGLVVAGFVALFMWTRSSSTASRVTSTRPVSCWRPRWASRYLPR